MLPVAFALAAAASTFCGGLVGLRQQAHLRRILGFTAGVLLGVVAFDILPEIAHIVDRTGIGMTAPMIALVAGFLVFHILEKLAIVHAGHEDDYAIHSHPHIGVLSALALTGHSFADGAAIGLAFQAGNGIGVAVAVAVVAHDFSDGLNTVALMLTHRNTDSRALRLLILDASAPVFGAASTLLFTLPDRILALYLSGFAGFLLYIGASDILPQAHSARPSALTMCLTVAGTALMFAVTQTVVL